MLRLEPDIEPSSLAETINQIEAEFQAGHAEWRAETGRARAKPRRFTAKDRRNVAALLRDRYAPFTPDELCRVAHGWRFSSWHRGDDPRTGGHRYHDAGLIFRDAEKARMFLGFFDEAHERRGAESIDSVAEVGGEVITAEVIQSWEARVRRGEAPAYDASEAEVWAYERAKANVEAAAMRPTAVAL
ncbi:MAG TPA: hypothetical protein VNN74_11040 [Candidatus Micrarchaeia archaeon]|nr:hypothetical protein [Candidatus Micrarchaeia archaeon]